MVAAAIVVAVLLIGGIAFAMARGGGGSVEANGPTPSRSTPRTGDTTALATTTSPADASDQCYDDTSCANAEAEVEQPITLSGTVYNSRSIPNESLGESCTTNRFPHGGGDVIVTDEGGRTVGVGHLSETGHVIDGKYQRACALDFSVELEYADFYRLVIDGQGDFSYSRSELEAQSSYVYSFLV